MTDNVENLILEHLKALRNDLRELRELNTTEHNDIKARLSHLDADLIAIKRGNLETDSEVARQQVSIDALLQRIQKIERRLELT